MVGMDPHIWNVVIEHLTDFVDDARCQLWRHFGTSDPASDSFNFAFLGATDRFNFPSVHLSYADDSSAEWSKSSFNHFNAGRRCTALVHQKVERSGKAIDRLILCVISISRQGQLHLSFTKHSQQTHHLKVVGDTPSEVTIVIDLSTVISIDDAGSENKACSCLTDAHLTPICHFLNQLKQVNLIL